VFKILKGNAMAHITASRAMPQAGQPSATGTLAHRVSAAFGVWRQRRILAELPDHLRKDVGLTEADALREARRPLWDVPNHWRF
jgi:uncharacterized protein YjiS (DUF1127 family)